MSTVSITTPTNVVTFETSPVSVAIQSTGAPGNNGTHIAVGTVPPNNPAVNDIWVDTN